VECCVYRNDVPLETIFSGNYQGVVLSPGPEVPEKAGHLMKVLAQYLDQLPILGICLGHQAIGQYYGAKLVKGQKPMHGKVSKVDLTCDVLFKGMPEEINVVQYNSLLLEALPAELKIIAKNKKGEIMAIKHADLPVWGVQFHPEAALTDFGLIILKNWLVYNDIT